MKMGCVACILTAGASSPDEGRYFTTGAASPPKSLAWTAPRTRNCRPRTRGEHAEQTGCSSLSSGGGAHRENAMDTLYPRCAGIDVHKGNVVVCVRCWDRPGKVFEEVRTFSTMTTDLLALSDWLVEHGVTHVAMESTGVYWKPVFNILEGHVRSSWSMPSTSSRCPAARPTSRTASGSPSCCSTGCSRPSSCRPSRSGS